MTASPLAPFAVGAVPVSYLLPPATVRAAAVLEHVMREHPDGHIEGADLRCEAFGCRGITPLEAVDAALSATVHLAGRDVNRAAWQFFEVRKDAIGRAVPLALYSFQMRREDVERARPALGVDCLYIPDDGPELPAVGFAMALQLLSAVLSLASSPPAEAPVLPFPAPVGGDV